MPREASALLDDVIAIQAEEPSSSLITYIGQAYYLKGDLVSAITLLERATARGPQPEAESWRTAAKILQVQIPLTGSSDRVREIVSYFHPAAK